MFERLVAAGAIAAAAVNPCFAHAQLESSSPSNHAEVSDAPQYLSLKFDEAVSLAKIKLASNGKEVSIAVDKSAPANLAFKLPLPSLTSGNYTVLWTAVAADDGHVTKGSFSFTVATP